MVKIYSTVNETSAIWLLTNNETIYQPTAKAYKF